MSKPALVSNKVKRGMLHIMMTYLNLWEAQRTPTG